MKFRLLLSITAFLEASLPFPIQIYMLYQSLWFVYGQGDADLRWDLQSLSQAACFVWQDLLVFYLCCYCMALSARSRAGRGLPLSQDGPWAWEGAVCPLCLARLPCGGSAEADTHGLTSAEEPTDYLAVEQRCARITWRNGVSQKCCYSKIGICNVFVQFEATFTDAQSSWSAPGLHLKNPFAYE